MNCWRQVASYSPMRALPSTRPHQSEARCSTVGSDPSTGRRGSIRRFCAKFLFLAALGVSALLGSVTYDSVAARPAFAESELELLLRQLRSNDFRLRMRAALELGKLKQPPARGPLEAALNDEKAAVRAAAAAALKSLGNRKSLPALQRASNDSSEAVRSQVAAAIRSLDSATGVAYVVGLGAVESDPTVDDRRAGKYLRKAARRRLGRLPQVKMKAGGDNTAGLPELLLDARISSVNVKRSGPSLAVSAKVDFVLSRMPGREIKGRLTGAATVHGDAVSENNPKDVKRLQMEAVEAAADSALENVDRALRAAVQ